MRPYLFWWATIGQKFQSMRWQQEHPKHLTSRNTLKLPQNVTQAILYHPKIQEPQTIKFKAKLNFGSSLLVYWPKAETSTFILVLHTDTYEAKQTPLGRRCVSVIIW